MSHILEPVTSARLRRRSLLEGALVAAAASFLSVDASLPAFAAGAATRHPWLFLTDNTIWKTQTELDDTTRTMFGLVKTEADAILDQPVATHTITGGRLLPVSRTVVKNINTLAATFHTTGDQRYLTRLLAELDAVVAFPDWNADGHFLDAAEMCFAVAMAYDWCYDHLSPAQRSAAEQAMLDKALRPGLAVHEGNGVVLPGYPGVKDWHITEDNWNIVCNCGLVVGALALKDVQPQVCATTIENALRSMPVALAEFGPDGGYPEGLGYWDYAIKYLVAAIACLETATGDDRGLSSTPGLATTGLFPVHLSGPRDELFNYSDAGTLPFKPSESLWLGQRHALPASMWWGTTGATTMPVAWNRSAMALLWYRADLNRDARSSNLPLDGWFARPNIATMRSAWNDPMAAYLACKGGTNTTNHAHLDQGSFVFDADGLRWAMDLGMGDYNLPGYFDNGTKGPRWHYYITRAEAHNTMVFGANPDEDQTVRSTATITRRESTPDSSLVVIDLSHSHPLVSSWRRGFRLAQGRRELTIQDEFSLTTASTVWWFMSTRANIRISADGQSAELRLGGRTATATMASPAGARFVDAPAKPLWTSPNPPQQQGVEASIRRLAIRLDDVSQGTVQVRLAMASSGLATSDAPVTAIDQWSAGTASTNPLASLRINDMPLSSFDPDNHFYEVVAPAGKKLRIKGEALQGRPVRVTMPTSLPGIATVTTSPAKPHSTGGTTYRLMVLPAGTAAATIDGVAFTEAVVASGDDGNLPINTLDGSSATRWSCEGDGQWIAYDLGADGPLSSVQLTWFAGDRRSSRFDVQVAAAGATQWTTAGRFSSSGSSSGPETFSFDSRTVRYVRIVGHGNTENMWNSLVEAGFADRRPSVVIPPARLAGVTVTAPTGLMVGATGTVSVTGSLADGKPADLAAAHVEYVSSAPTVVSVSADGTLRALSAGTSTISAVVTMPDGRIDWSSTTVSSTDGTVSLLPVADTYVHDRNPDAVFGKDDNLVVKTSDPGYNRVGYMAFDTASVGAVSSVQLVLFGRVADDAGSTFDLVVMRASGELSESTTSWSSRPTLGERIGSGTFTAAEVEVRIDLTAALRDVVSRGEKVVLGLTEVLAPGTDGLSILVGSRESSHPARLEVKPA